MRATTSATAFGELSLSGSSTDTLRFCFEVQSVASSRRADDRARANEVGGVPIFSASTSDLDSLLRPDFFFPRLLDLLLGCDEDEDEEGAAPNPLDEQCTL